MPNRLASESSPYLLQHQNNPVDWYPWGPEALLKSRAEDKPIFLSIGYSACHWCHVMEHESFENDQIADYLNQHFVSVKVDREERPDLDQIYMQAVVAMNGHGGWPLSAFLTPDQDFFFGGTYWPPTTTAQMPGFDRVLASVLDAYHNKREQVVVQSKQITAMIAGSAADEQTEQFDAQIFQAAAQTLHNRFDSTFGGFGSAPKFPHPMDLSLLLSIYQRQTTATETQWESSNPEDFLQIVEVTLRKMAYGGIYDHLAGGFARYSVDARWLVPHFEKMLYDNAQLVQTFLRTYQVTGQKFFARIAQKTLDYVLNYLTDSQGGFYSTEDADSEGQEGKFYVWTVQEVLEVLGQDIGNRFCELYDVTPGGNFEGDSILNLPISYLEFAEKHQLDKNEFMQEMRAARATLLEHRDKRIRPGLDDKVITSWNALAIMAFADAAVLLDDDRYRSAAENCGHFLWQHLRDDQQRLLHTWRHGTAKLSAYLDDYAYLINAYVSLYRVAFDEQWLRHAEVLTSEMIDLFHDSQSGAFFYTAKDHEKLIARTREFQDSAVPSGNSMAVLALVRLGQLVGKQDWVELGAAAGQAATPLLKRAAVAASQTLIAMHRYLYPRKQFVLVASKDDPQIQRVVGQLQQHVRLDETLIVVGPQQLLDDSPLRRSLEGKTAIDGQPTLYVCENFHCDVPIVGWEQIEALAASNQ